MKVTEYLSIYAASLSTIVFLWNTRRAIPRYKVEIISGSDEIDGEFIHGIYISVKNPSPHSVHLAHLDLLYPYKKTNLIEKIFHFIKYRRLPVSVGWVHTSLSHYDVEDGFPLSIESGKSHGFLVPDKVLKKLLKDSYKQEVKASVQDQLWRRKYSKKFQYRFIDLES